MRRNLTLLVLSCALFHPLTLAQAAPDQAHSAGKGAFQFADINGEDAVAKADRSSLGPRPDEELGCGEDCQVESMRGSPRRIVVAPSAAGRSHVISEQEIPQGKGTGIGLTNLWLAPATPIAKVSPDQGFIPFTMQQMREPLYAITIVDYPPGTGQADPGMHATATIDHFYVIDGEIVLVLEDGEASLRAGDVAVVQGAMHGWRNDGVRPARLLFFVLPAQS